MKHPIRHTLALFTACTVLPAAGLLAQDPAAAASPAATATPSVSAPAGTTTAATGEEHEHGMMKEFEKLTPEEKHKLKAANEAAKQDPAYKAAEAQKGNGKEGKRAFAKARREAMIKADPSVAPILDKMREERHEDKVNKKD